MAITVRELVTKWGFKVNTKPLEDMDRRIAASKKLAKRMAIGIAGISAAVGVLLNQAGKFEQWRIAFETMLGSSERAHKLLEQIKKFTLETPFQLPQVVEGGKRLLAFGIEAEKLIPTLKILGDVSAGLGTDLGRMILNFGQVKAQAKLTGRELRDFAILGVPLLAELAKILNTTEADIQSMIFAGQISFEQTEQAFINMSAAGGRFANLMLKQMKALFGILSNVRDMFIQIAIALGNKLLPTAKRITTQFLNFLMINKELIELKIGKLIETTLKFLNKLLKVVVNLVKRVLFIVKLVGGLNQALRILLVLLGGFIAINFVGLLGSIVLSLAIVVKGIRLVGNEALIAQAKILLIPLAIGAAVAGLALIIDDLVAFFKGDKSLFGLLIEFIEVRLPKALRALADPLTPLMNFIDSVSSLGQAAAGIGGFLAAPIAPVLAGFGGGQQISLNAPVTVNVPAGTEPENVGREARIGVTSALTNIFKATFDSIEDRGK